jgi:hypothetical protein
LEVDFKREFARAIITAMPWSPIVPETSTWSFGRTRSGPSATSFATMPMPAVFR